MPLSGHGDDDALVRERRGTTPLATLTRGRSLSAVTGPPVRFYLAARVRLFFRRLPGDGRIDAVQQFYGPPRSDELLVTGVDALHPVPHRHLAARIALAD